MDGSDFASAVAAAVARAQAAWSHIAVPEEVFRSYLEARLPPNGDRLAALAALHAGDLYLACACARGDPRAIEAFETHALAGAAVALRTMSSAEDFAPEILQRLREHLLVARADAPPRIADYRGRGPIARWTRIVAVRAGLEQLRSQQQLRRKTAGAILEPIDRALDQELQLLRSRHGAELRRALEIALRSLEPRERNVLKLHVIDGLSLSQIGALYRVNKSTVSRWLTWARETVGTEARRILQAELKLSESEMTSLIGALESRFDLSISRIFAD